MIKYNIKTLLFVFTIVFLNSCGNNDRQCIIDGQGAGEGFVIPNLYQAINYRDTFNFGDTLWLELKVPSKLTANLKSCSIDDSSVSVVNRCILYFENYYNNIDYSAFDSLIISDRIDSRNILKRSGTDYISTFGVILKDMHITGIGDSTTNYDGKYIMISSWENKYCTFTECNTPYNRGFRIKTTFQNNQTYLPIHIRQ
ncbi:MAG TPA: hypothetical protein PKO18_03445 [Chitinophagales bacterium]|nr:hypothetical protein [Chitinophagales bacterium]